MKRTLLITALVLLSPYAPADDKKELDEKDKAHGHKHYHTPEHVTGTDPYPFPMTDERYEEEDPDPLELPADFRERFPQLTDEDVAFMQGKDRIWFFETVEDLEEEIKEKSPLEVKEWVDAMRSFVGKWRYEKGRDKASIAFNTESPEYNSWKARRPRSMDPKRDPGPIRLGRYGRVGGGPPTFGNLPLALTQEDLIEGEVEVAIVGAPLNMGSGWRDSGSRATTDLRLYGGTMASNDIYTQVQASRVMNIVDYGDIAIDNNSTERSMQHVREIVREIAETGAIPIIIGGDHSLEYPNVAALADVYGKEKVSVIHFDSHYDAWWGGAHLIDHGAPVYRLLNEGHIRSEDYIQVGLRARGPDKTAFEWMREEGMRYHTMASIERRGWDYALDRIVAEASEEGRKLHISFDIDVLDPVFATATGTPVPGGITTREAITIIRRLCAESNVVSFDIVEFHPALDPTYNSALNSVFIVKACLTGLAINKLKKEGKHYLSPLTFEHAIDNYYGDQQEVLDATEREANPPEEEGSEDGEDETDGDEQDDQS